MLDLLRNALNHGKVSSFELTKHFIKCAKSDKLGCFITVDEENALRAACEADKRIAAGERTPLLGIPFAVKDNICTKDTKTTCASEIIENFVPVYDAEAVGKLRENGAVIYAKTNMDEFGMGSWGTYSSFGTVRNPYNENRVAGGSSSGSAAAVASGAAPCALGTDTGGSIRLPASFCGVTGLKPTYGRVSRFGLIAFASSFDQIGVLANSARDCAAVTDVISGGSKDMTIAGNASRCTSKIGTSLKAYKIGIIKEFFDCADDVTKEHILAAAEFYKDAGAEVSEVSLSAAKYAVGAYNILSCAQAAANLARFDGVRYGVRTKQGEFEEMISENRSRFGKEVKRRILFGNYILSKNNTDGYYGKALKVCEIIMHGYDEIFSRYDFLISPTASGTAPLEKDAGNKTVSNKNDLCAVTANLAGLPSLSTTCGYDKDGLPIGMLLTGRQFDEAAIVAAADAFERDFKRREAHRWSLFPQ